MLMFGRYLRLYHYSGLRLCNRLACREFSNGKPHYTTSYPSVNQQRTVCSKVPETDIAHETLSPIGENNTARHIENIEDAKTDKQYKDIIQRKDTAEMRKRLKLLGGPDIQENTSDRDGNLSDEHIQELLNFNEMSKPEDVSISLEKWSEFREFYDTVSASSRRRVLPANIMSICNDHNLYLVARSFMDFLESRNEEINLPTLCRYIALCGYRVSQGDGAAEAELYKYYEIVKQKHGGVFDRNLCFLVCAGLSHTKYWREAFNMIECCKKIGLDLNASHYSAVIVAAFKNGDGRLAWQTMAEISQNKNPPLLAVYAHIVQAARDLRSQGKEEESFAFMMRLLRFIRHNRVYPPAAAIDLIKEWFEARPGEKWLGRYTDVSTKGHCHACEAVLTDRIRISDDEFALLKEKLVDSVIKGQSIWYQTTPQEFEQFVKFVDKTGPYDAVIDSLNVAYKFNHPKTQAYSLRQSQDQIMITTEHFLKRSPDCKVLLVGRKHMEQWQLRKQPTFCDYQQRGQLFMFLTDNRSTDDPYSLYAAFYSGARCSVVTSDFFRDAQSLMRDCDILFSKWRLRHHLKSIKFWKDGYISFQPAILYDCVTQSTPYSWHIPYESGIPRYSYEVPTTWLCLTQQQQRQQQQTTDDSGRTQEGMMSKTSAVLRHGYDSARTDNDNFPEVQDMEYANQTRRHVIHGTTVLPGKPSRKMPKWQQEEEDHTQQYSPDKLGEQQNEQHSHDISTDTGEVARTTSSSGNINRQHTQRQDSFWNNVSRHRKRYDKPKTYRGDSRQTSNSSTYEPHERTIYNHTASSSQSNVHSRAQSQYAQRDPYRGNEHSSYQQQMSKPQHQRDVHTEHNQQYGKYDQRGPMMGFQRPLPVVRTDTHVVFNQHAWDYAPAKGDWNYTGPEFEKRRYRWQQDPNWSNAKSDEPFRRQARRERSVIQPRSAYGARNEYKTQPPVRSASPVRRDNNKTIADMKEMFNDPSKNEP